MAMEQTFAIDRDSFGGISIDTMKHYTTDEEFGGKLKASITKWKTEGVRGLWTKVAKQHLSVIPICVQEGLEFHHAKPGYVMMNRWLPMDEENMLPEYANQYLGCAGFVVNDQNEVLLVKEKYPVIGHRKWKLPGGHAEAGEEISEASRREVLEETGVEADFECVLTFRHQHQYRYGCSDLYFVCLMHARTTDIKPCFREIAESCWMNVDEYLNHPDISDANRYIAERYRDYATLGVECLKPLPVPSYNKKTNHLFYSVQSPTSKTHAAKPDEGIAK